MSLFESTDINHTEWRDSVLDNYNTILKNLYELRDSMQCNKQLKCCNKHERNLFESNNRILKLLIDELNNIQL